MNDIAIKDDIRIENLIYEVRGKQVMLDADLAKLYDVETKRINEAVKNNPSKFPERFSWLLEEDEWELLQSKFSNEKIKEVNWGGRRTKPRVFTEQGVWMLSTILKSNIATRVNIAIMDAFVLMRKYISNDLIELNYMKRQILNNTSDIEKNTEDIKILRESFNKFDEKRNESVIFFDGQIYDAYSKIKEIFNLAKSSLIIVDNYADTLTLDIIKTLNINVKIITSPNTHLTKVDVEKYKLQYNNLEVYYDNTFHDRFFILDNQTVYHCGASVNKVGYKTSSIILLNDKEMCDLLINKVNKIIR